MAREYTIEFENVAVSAQVDLFEVLAADDKPIEIYGLHLAVVSELGDAAEEWLRIRVIRGHTTSGSGGATPTPQPLDDADAAAGFTADTNNTTIASAGTAVNLHSDAFNVRAGYSFGPVPESMGWKTKQTALLVVRLMAAPADAVNMSGTCYLREF